MAVEAGTFDARSDRVLVRSPMVVDEQGWRELSDLHTQTLSAAMEIGARSAERLAKSGEPGIEARNVLALFEIPRLTRKLPPPGRIDGP